MLIFPDPSVSTEYTDPNGSVWKFNQTGWVRQCDCPDGGGGDGENSVDFANVELLINADGFPDGDKSYDQWDVTGKTALSQVDGTNGSVSTARSKHGPASIRNSGNGTSSEGYWQFSNKDVGSGSWAFEFWASPFLEKGARCHIAGKWTNNSTTGRCWQVNYQRDLSEIELMHSPTGTAYSRLTAGCVLKANEWVHIAISYWDEARTFSLFVDGFRVVLMTDCDPIDPVDRPWNFGGINNTGTGSWGAYFDDVRLVIGQPVYTADFTPPSAHPAAKKSTVPAERAWQDDSYEGDENDI